ncbi:MAG TPA: 5-(carboxyamino)imidazole ribonucleotide mutase [bacterium]|nr:AIR carboxylase family protein [bacterium]HOK30302.1 5-(carboxyamino)imidazole ribonucleotide mutase [bacterium]HON71935.1 5-(carboxyamino)imidazole ribonucleotide mutase [bacterium]HOP56118.1 5-(carboxyamino)imidazole ribonucleotide mutase [bacterium]HRU32276.1 5-(carboxyamino)imidazole ribonucleotide mutase [bacterium]
MKAIIIMGSKGDLDWSKKIGEYLKKFDIPYIMRIASAHKVPLKVLDIIEEYENEDVVFITVAGRSNALSGFIDAQTSKPVIACPPYGDKFAGVDIFSTLRMPSGVAPLTVLEPEQAAIAACKIFAIKYKELEEKIKKYQKEKREEIEIDDENIKNL